MSDVPRRSGRPDDGERVDDDALADAILASYTSSLPIIRLDADADGGEPVAEDGPGSPVDDAGSDPAQRPAAVGVHPPSHRMEATEVAAIPGASGGEAGAPAPRHSAGPGAGAGEPGTGTGDFDYLDDEDGSLDEFDGVVYSVEALPAGTASPYLLESPGEPSGFASYEPEDGTAHLPRALDLETAGVEPTLREQRAGRATRLFWMWFAVNASVLSLATGGALLGLGMSLRQAVIAAVGGVALSFLPLGLGTLAGTWSGQPTLIVSRAGFGLVGNVLPAALGVISRSVWGGALLWLVGGVATAGIERATGRDGTAAGLVAVLAGAIVAGAVAVVGYGLLSRVLLVLGAVTAVVLVATVALTAGRVDLGAALGAGDGPWFLVLSGAVLVFSYLGLAWVHSSADAARYQAPRGTGSSNVLAGGLGAGVPALLLISWGATLAASSPRFGRQLAASPIDALADVLPAWASVVLGVGAVLGGLAGAALASYSGGFALQATGLPLTRAWATTVSVVLAGAVGAALTVLGTDAAQLIRDVLTTVAVPVAAWAGILVAEVLIRSRRFHTPSLLRRGGVYPDVRVVNVLALVLITVLAFGFTTARTPGLGWQGYVLSAFGVPTTAPLWSSDIGVVLALALGLLVPLLTAIPAIRRQEAVGA